MSRAFAALLLSALIPAVVGALTDAEINAQIEALRARVVALQAQLAMQVADDLPCLSLTRTLSRDMRGGDVRELQRFFIQAGFLASGNDTGYFGPLTEAAVQKWQIAESVVGGGSARGTGFGVVGPKTRTSIKSACSRANASSSSVTSVMSSPNTTPAPQPITSTSVVSVGVPRITISAPMHGVVTAAGGLLDISWRAVNAPDMNSVSLQLLDERGANVGRIASGLAPSGTYRWRLPQEKSDCIAGSSAFDCISNIAGCSGADVCSIAPGVYAILARLSGSVGTTSPPFSVAGSALTMLFQALLDPVGAGATSTPSLGTPLSSTASVNSCTHEGYSYVEGATLSVACEAGQCPSSTSGYITGRCTAREWCIPFTSYCSSSFRTIDVSAYEGGGAAPISGDGRTVNCPQLGWRVQLDCTNQAGCTTGWNICTGSGWVFDPDQSFTP